MAHHDKNSDQSDSSYWDIPREFQLRISLGYSSSGGTSIKNNKGMF